MNKALILLVGLLVLSMLLVSCGTDVPDEPPVGDELDEQEYQEEVESAVDDTTIDDGDITEIGEMI